ncbi:MAG: alpha/beta fold hydrolase [Synechococcales cyanobacterium RM1_1_8]|nr:alpha/beta fold hydrolase [Synechococcales cyanobacterium RM1_1_8]
MVSIPQTAPKATPEPTLAAPPSRFWQWRGHRIHYVKAGQSPQHPPLLLIHGFGASTNHWKKNIAELQSNFEVWAIDLLGFGQSDKAKANYSGRFWSQQIADFIEQVIGRPAILVGNSIGGYATLCTAAYSPAQVAGLVLLNSAGPFSDEQPAPPPKSALQRILYHLRKDLFQQSWIHLLVFANMRRRSAIRKTLTRVYFNQDAITDQLVEEIYQPALDQGSFQAFSAMFSGAPGEPIDALLAQLNCPLLLLWGSKDPWGRVERRSPKFRRYYPQLEEVFLEAGHCPQDEIPAIVNQHLRDWVLGL